MNKIKSISGIKTTRLRQAMASSMRQHDTYHEFTVEYEGGGSKTVIGFEYLPLMDKHTIFRIARIEQELFGEDLDLDKLLL